MKNVDYIFGIPAECHRVYQAFLVLWGGGGGIRAEYDIDLPQLTIYSNELSYIPHIFRTISKVADQNILLQDFQYQGYKLPMWSPNINWEAFIMFEHWILCSIEQLP